MVWGLQKNGRVLATKAENGGGILKEIKLNTTQEKIWSQFILGTRRTKMFLAQKPNKQGSIIATSAHLPENAALERYHLLSCPIFQIIF